MSRNTTRSDRPFRSEDRAVSEVIGAILVFALLFSVLVLIQVNAVPAANKQVEFEHNQRVTQDFQSLQDGLYQAGTTGSDAAVTVETGIVYPTRFFLFNPPPATGTIRTTDASPLTIDHAVSTGNVRDYWDGSIQEYLTKSITYQPDYNELPNAGTLTWAHSMLYTSYDNGNTYFNDATSFIDGKRIRLTLLDGQLSYGGLSTSVEMAPISTRTRTVALRNQTGEQVTINLTTDLTAEQFSQEIDETYVARVEEIPGGLSVVLEQGETYELSIAKVRVGTTVVPEPKARYITDVSGNGTEIVEGQSTPLVVEVRDRYNNPVSGVDVAATIDGPFSPGTDSVEFVGGSVTDEDGQVELRYHSPSDVVGNNEVSVETSFTNASIPQRQKTATFDLKVLDPKTVLNDANASDGDKVSAINPGSETELVSLESVSEVRNTVYDLNFKNNGPQTVYFNRTRISYYFPGSGNRPATAKFYNGSTEVVNMTAIPSEFVAVSPKVSIGAKDSVTPDDDRTIRIDFNDFGGGNSNPSISDDFFVLSIEFVANDGTVYATTSYFVGLP